MTYTVMVRLPNLGLLALASASGGVGVGSKVLWARLVLSLFKAMQTLL